MANPTTNYGFVLPTSSDLVTDLPADFDVALQGVDTRLKALQPGTTLGDLAYSSATANTNTRLAIGTTGQVLTVAGGVPAWATPAGGGGKVLQVVQATYATATTIATTTFTDTGLTATITPTLATSKILILVNSFSRSYAARTYSQTGIKLLRGATEIYTISTKSNNASITATGATEVELYGYTNLNFLDAPATTSATTYKLQGALAYTGDSQTLGFQRDSVPSSIILMEIGV
jgi:hypothetical protein